MSDIFNEYAKIAIDKGLIKESEKPQINPRYAAVDADKVQMLYGVRGKDVDERHIMEQAHPNSVIIAPAYDRVNGLVENNLERQNVMHYIATKPTHGKHINERYVKAKQELLNELLRTAFMLERDGHEDLMGLADNCANNLVKQAWSWKDIAGGSLETWMLPILAGLVASGPLGIAGGIAIGAAALGIAAVVNNFAGTIDQGVSANLENAKDELQDIIDDTDEATGYDAEIQSMINDLEFVKEKFDEINNFKIEPAMNADDVNYLNENGNDQIINDVLKGKQLLLAYKKSAMGLQSRISKWESFLQSIQARDEQSKGSHWYNPITEVLEYVWTPDVKDAAIALEGLSKALNSSLEAMSKLYTSTKQSVEANKESLEQAVSKMKESDMPEEKLEEKPTEQKSDSLQNEIESIKTSESEELVS